MPNTVEIIVYPVTDIEKAKSFYNTYLGTEPYADSPYYVGYKVNDMEIGLDPNGTAVISYINSDDIEADLKTLQATGATIVKDSMDVGGGLHVAQVEINGNVMGLRQQPQTIH